MASSYAEFRATAGFVDVSFCGATLMAQEIYRPPFREVKDLFSGRVNENFLVSEIKDVVRLRGL
jgi:hypothetical protein